MKLRHVQTLGGKGERPDQFRLRLTGIAVDSGDCLLAVGDREIKRFSSTGRFLESIPTSDVGWSLAVDGAALWVGLQGRIDRLDELGAVIDAIDDPQRLGLVSSLVAKGNTLIAADATHRTIHWYDNGVWKGEIGRDANTRGFMIPNGILDLAFEPQREAFLVAHPQKHRIERYSLSGVLIDKWGRFGAENPADFGGCCNPTNVAAISGSLVAISEKAPPRLKLFTHDGKFVSQFVGLFDVNAKNIDLAADHRGRLYATDPVRCTIEVFESEATST